MEGPCASRPNYSREVAKGRAIFQSEIGRQIGVYRELTRCCSGRSGAYDTFEASLHRKSPCFSSHAWMYAATSLLFLSIIIMCELPLIPTLGRSTTSTLPPALLTAS